MDSFLRDVRHALRSLLRQPGFFAIAVLTLALGVGSVSAIYSVVDGVLLKPLPYPDAGRIVRIVRQQGNWSGPVSAPALEDWREGTREVFASVAGFVATTANLTGQGDAERLSSCRVTPEFWDVMQLPPVAGRYFGAEEDRANERVVVISHKLWLDRFGGRVDVIGEDVVLDGQATRIVAVAPASFRYPGNPQIFLPTYLEATPQNRGNNFLMVLARLRSGSSLDQANAVMATVNARLAQQYPDNHAELGARLTTLPATLSERVRQPLLILLGAASLVLLIACANLANLLLARGNGRRRELAVRAALGAGRGQLVRTTLAEVLVIALLGGLLGVVIAAAAVPLVLALAPQVLPSHATPGMDLRVVAVALGVSVLTILAFSLWPAFRAADVAPAMALSEDARGASGGRERGRLRAALVVGEVALSLTLLVGAGLMIESLRQLGQVEGGVETEGVLTAGVVFDGVPPVPGESQEDGYRRWIRAVGPKMDALLARVAAIPGVERVGITDALPLSGMDNTSSDITIVGRDVPDGQPAPGASWRFVSPGLFDALGMRIVRGRNLEAGDLRAGEFPGTVLVNETFVRRYLADVDPIGQHLSFFGLDGEAPKRVVGVVSDTRLFGIEREPVGEVYMLHGHSFIRQMALAIKVRGSPQSYAEQLRQAIREVDPSLPLFAVRTMDEVAGGTVSMRRFNMSVMSLFSGVALLLSVVGLYGVIAYSVAQRRRELGIRMSLGAAPSKILAMVVKQGARLVGLGLVLGLMGALALGQVIASQLYGVSPREPLVMVGVVLVLACAALLACFVPAWRASRLDPVASLRAD